MTEIGQAMQGFVAYLTTLFLSLSGGTVTGPTIFQQGLTAQGNVIVGSNPNNTFMLDGNTIIRGLSDGTLQITKADGTFPTILLGAAGGASTGVQIVPSNGGITVQNGAGAAGFLVASNSVKTNAFTPLTTSGTANFDGFQFIANTYNLTGAPTQGNSSRLVTNVGASGQTVVTLPAASVGLWFPVYNAVATGLQIKAPSGVTIQFPGAASSAGGTQTTTTIGASAILICVSSTVWAAFSPAGTWVAA